jgi:hypothetical protein
MKTSITEKVFRVTRRQCNTGDTVGRVVCKHRGHAARGPKIRIITIGLSRDLSEIKLKRTDTTLDLSQKAKRAKEKRRKGKQSFLQAGEDLYRCWEGGERPD